MRRGWAALRPVCLLQPGSRTLPAGPPTRPPTHPLACLPARSVEALGLTAGAVFCVPASTPAVEAFGRMAVDHKSCLGLVDAAGKLVRWQ